jgi:hypothetical protein
MRIDRGLSFARSLRRGDARIHKREEIMTRHNFLIRSSLLAASMLASPAVAADVTPERLLNPDKEPQNWLILLSHKPESVRRI